MNEATVLSFVDSRSAALRLAVESAPTLDARVPGCPDWSLRDLVAHLGGVQRFWTAVVAAGPAGSRPPEKAVGDRAPRGDLVAWSAESTELLLSALRAADPAQACWTWWGESAAPSTVGAVARHQMGEAAVHAFDAQEAVGRPEPVPAAVAGDGVAEFLAVTYGTAGGWPHRPARIRFEAAGEPAVLVDLDSSGASVVAGSEGREVSAVLRGDASDLLLVLHGRVPVDRIRVEGDAGLVDEVLAWPSLA